MFPGQKRPIKGSSKIFQLAKWSVYQWMQPKVAFTLSSKTCYITNARGDVASLNRNITNARFISLSCEQNVTGNMLNIAQNLVANSMLKKTIKLAVAI